ncbi:MAG: glycosyltransferase [Colwellia sp.]|nr:glycosyltransferase [Colwellia sp.]
MSNTPLVSVYITTKNRCVLLQRAIDSVVAQTWPNIEIIICDDGSEDGTDELIHKYTTQHDNIIYLKNDYSRGACFSRNRAIEKAQGLYITGLDDDDYFLPQRVEKLMAAFKPEYSFVCSTYIRKTNSSAKHVKDGVGKLTLSDLLHYNRVGNQVLSLTARFKQIGGFDESLPAFQDYDMWVRMLKEFGDSIKIPEPLYVFDISHANERISSSPRVQEGYKLFLAKHRVLMNKKHLDSMELLSTCIKNSNLSVSDAVRLCNRGNYKSVINSLLKRS